MNRPEDIRIEEFDYPLPDERIAKFPVRGRDTSKLLVYKGGDITETVFRRLPDQLSPDTLLVFNNTRVIQARIHFRKESGANIEIFCLEPDTPSDYALSFQSTGGCRWLCLVGNSRKWKEGELERQLDIGGQQVTLRALRIAAMPSGSIIEFRWDSPGTTFSSILEAVGELPIPPYLNRAAEESDKETYQTVYSKIDGSVAAPTAGLHFTRQVFDALSRKGIEKAELTLHVGAGTFKPVKSDTIGGHEMHTELISVSRELIGNLATTDRKVVAVGTTSVRTLESLYHIGAMLLRGEELPQHGTPAVTQWQPYMHDDTLSRKEAFAGIAEYMDREKMTQLVTSTQIIIVPGYKFRVADGIITNFHQPRSTLLLLVSAFVDGDWRSIYDYALGHSFRFLSYGDSSLLLRR